MCCNGFRMLVLFTFVVISFILNNFFDSIPVILWYIVSINIFTFFLFLIDKFHAIKERKRVPEFTLYFLSFAGGIFGAFTAMLITRHKLQKNGFLYMQIAILIVWVFAIYFVLHNLDAIQTALRELTK